MPPFFDQYGDPTMDPYTILSLPHTASDADIKKAYRMQMLQLHPDKLAPTLGDASIAEVTEKFHNVKDAYEFLVSPMHLTSRRLYMAKMASRRAEYERREAFMRRGMGGDDYYTAYASRPSACVNNYRSGGGGAAGMAGTGMPHPNSHSYPMPTKEKMNRSKSEPEMSEDRYDGRHGDPRGTRRPSGNGMYKNATMRGQGQADNRGRTGQDKAKRKDKKMRERNVNGYKSEGDAKRNKSSKDRERKSRSKKDKTEKQHRQRTKSEEPRNRRNKHYESNESEGEKKKRTKDKRKTSFQDNNDEYQQQQQQQQEKEKRRAERRSKSAPARYARNNKRDKRTSSPSNKNSKDNGDLPKEFFCPLTKRLMKDPVRDAEGNAYEREAIERWLRVQSSSPITNGYMSLEMLRPDSKLKKAIYKATGKPRSKSTTRGKSRAPTHELVSGRVLIDSYLREISSKSKLSVSLDGMGICAFSYRRITFVIEVPITPHAGFMVYSSFDGEADKYKLSEKMDAWNKWLSNIGRHSRVSHVRAGQKTVFTLRGNEGDMAQCDVFQKTLEYFVEMSLKLHNLLHPKEAKVVENVRLTRAPVPVA